MCNCHAFTFAQQEGMVAGKHSIVNVKDFSCRICDSKRFTRHGDDGDYFGYVFECNSCHEYVKYTDKNRVQYKEEFYLENYCIIQEDDTMIVDENSGRTICNLPKIEFTDRDKFLKRIKNLIIFS